MFSIAASRACACAVLSLASCGALAAGTLPRVLREPVLGLRYEVASVKFDPLPASAIANCETLADNKDGSAVWYVYARASDASGRTFYVTGGYEIRHGAPAHLKYETDGLGVVFSVDRGTCTVIDSARQVFDDRLFDDELPQPMLRQLADDLARRLARAFGGAGRLQAELRNQHIERDELPPELREALGPYAGPAVRH